MNAETAESAERVGDSFRACCVLVLFALLLMLVHRPSPDIDLFHDPVNGNNEDKAGNDKRKSDCSPHHNRAPSNVAGEAGDD